MTCNYHQCLSQKPSVDLSAVVQGWAPAQPVND